jgi:hypothetical protein
VDRPAAELAEDADFYRWYGDWAAFKPREVAARLEGMPARWWIVGGWALDAFTGLARDHEDVDVAFFRADLPLVLEHLGADLCVWTTLSGTLRPLRKPEDLLPESRQLWVRPDGNSPWVMDLAMTPHEGDTWISPRDERVRRPFEEATFVAGDGIRYLRPELVLFMKARFARTKDTADLERTLPALNASSIAWLREAIELVHSGHSWLDRFAGRLSRRPEPKLQGRGGASDRAMSPSRKSRISRR